MDNTLSRGSTSRRLGKGEAVICVGGPTTGAKTKRYYIAVVEVIYPREVLTHSLLGRLGLI